MNDRSASPALTRNQTLVLDTLSAEQAPLSAYAILDRLRDEGLKAPPQIYRALEKLVETGKVHRLESLNAFVACNHPACQNHATTAFAICTQCGTVRECTDDALRKQVRSLASATNFTLTSTTVEMRGLCGDCVEK